jgi:predicted RNA-binding Zn ribbon-like protein
MPRRVQPPDPDLELAVALVNTVDNLEDPPDRLTTDEAALRLLREHSTEADVLAWTPADLGKLRSLRDRVAEVFSADDEGTIRLVNAWLAQLGAVAQLVPKAGRSGGAASAGGADGWAIGIAVDAPGVDGLGVRFAAALARFVAQWGPARLGCCAADPCRCAYVDRTPAGTRRYCCQWCTDRMAAAAYRRRGRR